MSTTVTVYGKMRIPTEAHKGLIDHAANIAKTVGGKLDVTLSGSDKPLSAEQKQKHATNVFGNKVNVKPSSTLVSHLKDLSDSGVKHLHLVAGSDRVPGYRNLIDRYNGKKDKSGNVPFSFDTVHIHQFGSERQEEKSLPRHPSKIKNILPFTSATRVQKYAQKGDYEAFKAFYRNTPEHHVKKIYDDIRNSKESLFMTFKQWLMEQIL